jgi:hypothetical protein
MILVSFFLSFFFEHHGLSEKASNLISNGLENYVPMFEIKPTRGMSIKS